MTTDRPGDAAALLATVRAHFESQGLSHALQGPDDDVVAANELDSLGVIQYLLLLTDWFGRPLPDDPADVERLRTVRGAIDVMAKESAS